MRDNEFLKIWCRSLVILGISLPYFQVGTANKAYAQFLLPSEPTKSTVISSIKVIGNKTVSSETILNNMALKPNSKISEQAIAKDIQSVFAIGYFQDVLIAQTAPQEITVQVVEKPTIVDISYEGFDIVSVNSLKEKFNSKKFTILDEKKISQDLRTIEQAYVEKGYYLAKATYSLQQVQSGTVNLIFKVTENIPIKVRNVSILGNEYFSDTELLAFMGTKPFSWLSFFTSSGVFKDEYTSADQQNLTYIYRDNGYAEATVAAPIAILNKSKTDVDVTFYIEQGERFHIGTVEISGDLIESEDTIKQKLSLTEGRLYKISKFNADMKALKNYYGDHGYAFAYIYPKFNIDRKNKIYNISYTITKGEKAYFRNIIIEGNLKTRDNVIRRELRISEGQLFNSTNIDKSKSNINRLGFFEGEVSLNQEPDQADNAMDIRIAVKEKSTGNLQASLGASPNANGGSGVSFFGSVQYQEKNLLGKAYGLGANIQISPSPQTAGDLNYTLSLNFSNPSIFDSPWSYGVNATYQKQIQSITTTAAVTQAYLTQKVISEGVSVGREIVENLRFTLGYNLADYKIDPSVPLTAKFWQSGRTEEFSQTLTFDKTDNSITPSSGYSLSASNALALKVFAGENTYGKSTFNATYYVPVPVSDSFKTNFRFALIPQFIYPTQGDGPIPFWKRLSLGNSYFMKGYSNPGETIAPTIPVAISPLTGQTVALMYGGNRSFYGVAEYFIPLVPEAGLRFVTFGEAGSVLTEGQSFSFADVKYDAGFGFRWVTPIAPFRFEWAFPVDHGQLGPAHFVFTIGYDNFGNGS